MTRQVLGKTITLCVILFFGGMNWSSAIMAYAAIIPFFRELTEIVSMHGFASPISSSVSRGNGPLEKYSQDLFLWMTEQYFSTNRLMHARAEDDVLEVRANMFLYYVSSRHGLYLCMPELDRVVSETARAISVSFQGDCSDLRHYLATHPQFMGPPAAWKGTKGLYEIDRKTCGLVFADVTWNRLLSEFRDFIISPDSVPQPSHRGSNDERSYVFLRSVPSAYLKCLLRTIQGDSSRGLTVEKAICHLGTVLAYDYHSRRERGLSLLFCFQYASPNRHLATLMRYRLMVAALSALRKRSREFGFSQPKFETLVHFIWWNLRHHGA